MSVVEVQEFIFFLYKGYMESNILEGLRTELEAFDEETC
jgi:hypothetical protein